MNASHFIVTLYILFYHNNKNGARVRIRVYLNIPRAHEYEYEYVFNINNTQLMSFLHITTSYVLNGMFPFPATLSCCSCKIRKNTVVFTSEDLEKFEIKKALIKRFNEGHKKAYKIVTC